MTKRKDFYSSKRKRDFEYLIKVSQFQVTEKANYYVNDVLEKLLAYMSKMINENPNLKIEDIIYSIREDIATFLTAISSHASIRSDLIEYQIQKNLYHQSSNINSIYSQIIEKEKRKEIDILNMNLTGAEFSFSVEKSLELILLLLMQDLRIEYKKIEQEFQRDPFMQKAFNFLLSNTKSNRKKIIEQASKYNPEAIQVTEKLLDLYRLKIGDKKEVEFLTKKIQERSASAMQNVKSSCISSIIECVEFLDKFGFLKQYVDLSNKEYFNMGIQDMKYSYNEVLETLSEENLRKLNTESLIILSAFWLNRTSKIVKELNSALYIVVCPELFIHSSAENFENDVDTKTNDEASVKSDDTANIKNTAKTTAEVSTKVNSKITATFSVSQEDINNVILKMQVIHKMFLNLYGQFDKARSQQLHEGKALESTAQSFSESSDFDIEKSANEIITYYQDEYKRYFQQVFPNSENDLSDDFMFSNICENANFNLYRLKNFQIQSLLTCLLNNSPSIVENYGYIPETNKDIRQQRVILIGVDMKGFNMPLRLHIDKEMLLDVLRDVQDGGTLFPIYQGYKDFKISSNKVSMATHIYVPLSPEKEAILQKNVDGLVKRKTIREPAIRHIHYLTKKAKMPDHLKNGKKKFKPVYIDLDPSDELDKKDR